MIRLFTLGGLAVQSSQQALLARQASLQGLILLARIAVAGTVGLTRDKLVGCFWPDRDERHARHSLSQALHRVRSELRSRAVVLGTSMLSLNPESITADVHEFAQAAHAGEAARAVELYTGPFLDGVFLDGAPQVDEWIETERRRLADLHAHCLRQLARAADDVGNHREAASLWRRLTAADPLDGQAVLALAESLEAAGDRNSAVREVKRHESAVQAELGEPLHPMLRRFVDQSRIVPVSNSSPPGVMALCARAWQLIHGFEMKGYAEAVRLLHQAIALDPARAEPHVALAALYVLQSQADPRDDARALGAKHCRRAIELDSRIPEPHLWLGCAAMLDDRFDEAEAHAERGLLLDPNAYFSRHLVAWVYLADALKTGSPVARARSIECYRRAVEIDPDEQGVLTSIGCFYCIDGQYELAESFFRRALDAEYRPVGVRMIGARTLLGTVQLRQRKWAAAEANLEGALAEYHDAPQMFAPYVNALTLCGLGDARRFASRCDEAVECYLRARTVMEGVTEMMGGGYLDIRLNTRLASAYHHLWMRREEMECVANALSLTRSRQPGSFNWCWLTSEGELHYDWAIYHATCGDRSAAIASLAQAIALSWRETASVEHEPAFAMLRADDEFRLQLEVAAARPPLPPIRLAERAALRS